MIFRFTMLFVVTLLTTSSSLAQSTPQANDGPFSTNWLNAAKSALSITGELSFKQATNQLAKASNDGNVSAQALWGFTQLMLSRSSDNAEAGLQLLRRAAQSGNTSAMLQLGDLLEGGKYVRQNYNESFHWFKLAADTGDSNAQLKLGRCYQYGLGTTPDHAAAAKYYRMAAEQTNYVAMKNLGFVLINGQGVATNLTEAKQWLLRAANEGRNARAMYNLGVLCSAKFPDTNAVAEAFSWFKQGAELNDCLAAYQLSVLYLGKLGGIPTNIASHRYWRFKAATLGSTEAQFYLGQAYHNGDGVPKDSVNSLNWYQKAANKNHPLALMALAVLTIADNTNRESLLKAKYLMTRAAMAGHRDAQFQCALSCFRGDIEPVDFETGKLWLAKSAEAGYPSAEFLMFQVTFNGYPPFPGCPPYPKDKAEGIKWLRRAAAHKYPQAQTILAVMLIRGQDVEQDKAQAEELLRDAAEHGYPTGQSDLGFAILSGSTASQEPAESAMWSTLAIPQLKDPAALKRCQVNLANAMSQLTPEQKELVAGRVKSFQPLPSTPFQPLAPGWERNPQYQQEDGLFGK